MAAYYNEIDPYAAAWLRNLIAAGHIAPGDVDERSIQDVRPDDLRPYVQCHFFAGIGVWSHALRAAGWPDDRPVWTGSCPCQPFSAAGAGLGFDDERHLWPDFGHLILECSPAIVLGEQVASKDADAWIDLVQTDMEAMGYAFGAVPFPSAGVGAPHIRDRLYWVADAECRPTKRHGHPLAGAPGRMRGTAREQRIRDDAGDGRDPSGLADANDARSERRSGMQKRSVECASGSGGVAGGVADTDGGHPSTERQQRSREQRQQSKDGGIVQDGSAGPTNGLWRDADWLLCRDGKWRPVEPGTFPLVDGATNRVGRLRAYGNAVNAQAARVWVECVMESL